MSKVTMTVGIERFGNGGIRALIPSPSGLDSDDFDALCYIDENGEKKGGFRGWRPGELARLAKDPTSMEAEVSLWMADGKLVKMSKEKKEGKFKYKIKKGGLISEAAKNKHNSLDPYNNGD